MTDTPTYTEEQLDEMRVAIAADDARKAAEGQAKRDAYMPPLKALLNSDCYRDTLEALKDLAANHQDDGSLSIHVNALAEIMPRLANAAGVSLDPVAEDPAAPEA